MAANIKLDERYLPCPLEPGDEAFPKGIFVFNLTRRLTYIDAHPEYFPVEAI